MKVLRSTLLAAVAVVAAACGDKVNVVQATPPTPQVNSVTVSPATANLTVGQTLNMVAAVNADAGATYTVAWTTSDASKVSVNATSGVITAVANTPGIAICAAAGGKQGCASIIVGTTGPTPVAGSVSIASVNFTNGAGQQQPAPVPPGAVGTAVGIAQVNVVMNLNIGTTTADSIVLRISGVTAYRQAFSAAQVAALRAAAAVDELGQLNGNLTITASVNVADYCSPALAPLGVGPTGTCPSQTNPPGANILLGTARWLNGNQSFQAFYYGKQVPVAGGSPVNSQSSSPVATYRFANLDGFHLNMAITPVLELPDPTGSPTAQQLATATDLAGFSWKGGTMALTAWFIQYTVGVEPNPTLGLVQASYNNFGCSVGGVRSSPMVKVQAANAALTAGPWTATLIGPTAQGSPVSTGASGSKGAVLGGGTTVGNLIGIEFNPAVCPGAIFTSGGEMPSIAAVGTDNNNILTFGAGFNGGAGIINTFANSNNSDQGIVARIDNVAPALPSFSQQAGGSAATTVCTLQGTALVNTFNSRTNCWFNDAVVLNGLAIGFNTGSAVGTSTVAGTTANGDVFSGIDVGSGRQVGGAILTTFTARADLATVAAATVDGNAAITSTASLAESGVNNLYQLRIRSTDPLNNTRNTAAGSFGVDRTPPTLAEIGGPPNGARNIVAGGTYILNATDPLGLGSGGPVLGSGFFSASLTPVTVSQAQRTAAGTTFWCPSAALGVGAYQSSSTTCSNTAAFPGNNGWVSGTNFLSNFNFSDTHASILDAYFTATSTIADQAGNVGPVPAFSLLELVDATASSLGGLTYNPGIFAAGAPATFSSASIADNLDVQGAGLNLTYGASGGLAGFGTVPFGFVPTSAVGGATFWYNSYNILFPNQVGPVCPNEAQLPFCDFRVNTWPTATTAPAALIQSTTFSATIPNMVTNIQVPTDAFGGARTLVVGNNLNNANGFAYNQACTTAPALSCTSSGLAALAIPSSALPVQGAILGGGVASPNGGPIRWNICAVSTATGTCAAVDPVAPGASTVTISRDGAAPTTVFLTAVAAGLSASSLGNPNFANPFAQVQFWAYNPTLSPALPGYQTEGWRLIGTVNAPNATTDAGLTCSAAATCGGRNWSFGILWDPQPGTAITTGAAYQIMAIGIMNATSQPGPVPASAAGMALATPVSPITVTVAP
jgi:hypothetical protein